MDCFESGIQPGDATFALPQYSSANLKLLGTSTETDGFGGVFSAYTGSFFPMNIQFGCLDIYDSFGYVSNATFRLAGVSGSLRNAITMVNPSRAFFNNCTFEFGPGAIDSTFGVYGASLNLRGCSLNAISGVTVAGSYFTSAEQGIISSRASIYSGLPATIPFDISLQRGSSVFVDNPTLLPLGGTIARSNPSLLNSFGVATCSVRVSGSGILSAPIGIVSVVREDVGIYLITHTASQQVRFAVLSATATIQISDSVLACQIISATQTRVFSNTAGAASNRAFNFVGY